MSPCKDKIAKKAKRVDKPNSKIWIDFTLFPFESGDSSVLYYITVLIPSPELILIFIQEETVDIILMFSNLDWGLVGSDVLCYDLVFIFIINSNEGLLIVEDFETVFCQTPVLPL
jgi:hypothetical protein